MLDAALPRVFAAVAVGDEVLEHLPAIARRRRLDLGLLLAAFSILPVIWVEESTYSRAEADARKRISARDADDWPTVAVGIHLSKARSVVVWTQDKDFEVSGLATITTGALLDALAATR